MEVGGKVRRKVKVDLSDPHRSWFFLQFSSVSSVAQLCPTAAHQAFLFITNSQSLLKLTSVESVMPSNYLILCHPLLLLPSVFSCIGVFFFSNDSALHIRWPEYWRFSINPSNEYSGLTFLGLIGLISCSPRDSQESSPTPQFKSINSSALSFLYSPTLTSSLPLAYYLQNPKPSFQTQASGTIPTDLLV